MSSDPKTPKARLVELLGDMSTAARWGQAAAVMEYQDSALLVRLALLDAGIVVPPGDTAADLVRNLARMGWRTVPAGLREPEIGDIWVESDAKRQPTRVGFVGRRVLSGVSETTFETIHQGAAARQRRTIDAIDFWLIYECRECAARARPAGG